MKYNHDWLHAQLEAKEKIKYLFFWGHQPKKDATIGQTCLSQWFECAFEHEGITYPTAEHWMMAEKARLFQDKIRLEKILKAHTAAEAKKLGRQVQNFEQTTWIDHRERIVLEGNLLKFRQHKALWIFLDSTKSRVLVEASPVDRIWGIGLAANTAGVEYAENWRGLNLLGYILMEVRDKLRKA